MYWHRSQILHLVKKLQLLAHILRPNCSGGETDPLLCLKFSTWAALRHLMHFLCRMRLAHTNAGTFCDLMQKTLQLLYTKARRRRSSDPKRHLVFSLPCAVPFPYQTRKADFHHGSFAFAARTPRCLRYATLAVRCLFQSRGCPMSSSTAHVWSPSVSANPRGSELGLPQWAVARATSEVWGRYRRGSSESSLTCHHAIFGEVTFPDSKPRKWWDPPLLDVNSQNPTAELPNENGAILKHFRFFLVCYQQDTLPHHTMSTSRNESLKGVSNFWIVSC